MNFSKSGSVVLPVVLGSVIVLLGILSGYLFYSNTKITQESKPAEGEVTAEDTTLLDLDVPKEDSNLETKLDVKSTVKQSVTTSQKSLSTSTTAGSKSAWNVFYDEMIALEGDFFVDYETVDLDVVIQSDLSFQENANKEARATLDAIVSKTTQGQLAFPSQVACLNKEKEAFKKYEVVLDLFNTFLAYSRESVRTDELNGDILNKARALSLRISNEERDKALEILDQMQDMLKEAKTHAQKANSIISFQGAKDYVEWVNGYSVGLSEIRNAVQQEDYDKDLSTDFVALGEAKEKAVSDWSEQLGDWVVANINPAISAADKSYSQSNSLCSRE